MAKIVQVDFQIIGIKHVAPFADYPAIIPEKVEQMIEREKELSDVTTKRVIVYEPKEDAYHETGFFYTGVIVKEKNDVVPADMEAMHLSGEYAVLETVFDPRRMGEYYTKIDQWMVDNGYLHRGDELLIEVYEHTEEELALSIYIPVVATPNVIYN